MEEKIFMNYDEQGNILGFYNNNHENIPTPNKEISKDLRQFLLDTQDKKIKIDSLNKDELTIEDFETKVFKVISLPPTLEERNRADIDYLLMISGGI